MPWESIPLVAMVPPLMTFTRPLVPPPPPSPPTLTPSVVLSDVVMPEMDGPTMLREMRKTNKELKIIFVSGYADDAFKRNLDENETFHFLPKPFNLKTLAETVKTVLAQG